jgi:alcohol dehydrogenase YqhD (iron-dependent ADH family)
MQNFIFSQPTKIIFGKESENEITHLLPQYASKVLLHYGSSSAKKTGVFDKVASLIKKCNIEFIELGGVCANPRLSLVYEGIELCRKNDVDFIIAIGGGSVIDSAKGIAAGVNYDGDVWDLYMKKDVVKSAIGIGVVLTIPAAGSESANGSVITKEEGSLKKVLNSDFIKPKFAVLNPEFTYTLPPFQVACGCADMLAHMMERYFTNEPDVDLTDRILEGAMKHVVLYSKLALDNPADYAIKAEIMWAGTIAHNNMLSTGRIGDWASHAIEVELSGMYDVAHGAGLAVIFPAWIKYVYKTNMNRFIQFFTRVFDVDYAPEHPERIISEGLTRLEGFYQSLGLPTRLPELGIGDDRFEELARKCLDGISTVGNLKKLNGHDICEIYKLAL